MALSGPSVAMLPSGSSMRRISALVGDVVGAAANHEVGKKGIARADGAEADDTADHQASARQSQGFAALGLALIGQNLAGSTVDLSHARPDAFMLRLRARQARTISTATGLPGSFAVG